MTDEQRDRPEPVDVTAFHGHKPTLKEMDFRLFERAPDILADLIATRQERDEARAEIKRLQGLVSVAYDEGISAGTRLPAGPSLRTRQSAWMGSTSKKMLEKREGMS